MSKFGTSGMEHIHTSGFPESKGNFWGDVLGGPRRRMILQWGLFWNSQSLETTIIPKL